MEAKAVDTTHGIATTNRLFTQEWSLGARRIDIPDLMQWIDRNSYYTISQVGPPRKRKQSVMASAALLPEINTPEPFRGLNVNHGYDHIERYIIDELVAHWPHQLKGRIHLW